MPIDDKVVLIHAGFGQEVIELYTSQDRGVTDDAETFPAVYLAAAVDGACFRLGPFRNPEIYAQLAKALRMPINRNAKNPQFDETKKK